MNVFDSTKFVNLNTYAAYRKLEGEIVTILDSMHEARGLELISSYSRAITRNSIHELIATDEEMKRPGDQVNAIAYLGFFEVEQGSCLVVGEKLTIGGEYIGRVLGFDLSHEPNHMNIVIGVEKKKTGRELGLKLGSKVIFEKS
jgi:hypothetical protein